MEKTLQEIVVHFIKKNKINYDNYNLPSSCIELLTRVKINNVYITKFKFESNVTYLLAYITQRSLKNLRWELIKSYIFDISIDTVFDSLIDTKQYHLVSKYLTTHQDTHIIPIQRYKYQKYINLVQKNKIEYNFYISDERLYIPDEDIYINLIIGAKSNQIYWIEQLDPFLSYKFTPKTEIDLENW